MSEIFPKDSKVNLLDFDAVYYHVRAICEEEGLNPDNSKELSKALTLFALQSRFDDLSADEAWDCIVDGSNDQGIDAIYIEESDKGDITANIFQTKCFTSREKVLDKSFSGNDLDKFIEKFDNFIVQRNYLHHANEKLQLKLKELFSHDRIKYRLCLITTGNPPAQDATERFLGRIRKYNKTSDHVSAEFIGLERLSQFLPQRSQAGIDTEIQLDGNYVEDNAGRSRVLIGRVQGRVIAELVREHGEKLFQKNVRGYLKRKNTVNQNIYSTATSADSAPYFFVLNNGITVVCDKLDYMSGQRSPKVTVKGAQIVNGGQTSNSLFGALYDDKLEPSVNVVVRIIETDDQSVLEKITEATNRQTAVNDRDLHSNDDVQKLIKAHILSRYGFYYESRKNENEGKVPIRLRMDAEKAAQAYFAYYNQEPAIAKSYKSQLFNKYYEDIFDVNNDKLPEELFYVYKLQVALDMIKKDFFDQYSFMRDASTTVLALLKGNSKLTNLELLEEDASKNYPQLRKEIETILVATQKVVDEEVKRIGDKFEKRRLFIAPSTIGRIQESIQPN